MAAALATEPGLKRDRKTNASETLKVIRRHSIYQFPQLVRRHIDRLRGQSAYQGPRTICVDPPYMCQKNVSRLCYTRKLVPLLPNALEPVSEFRVKYYFLGRHGNIRTAELPPQIRVCDLICGPNLELLTTCNWLIVIAARMIWRNPRRLYAMASVMQRCYRVTV